MRKFVSLIAAVLFAGSMMASVVTLDPSTQTDAPASSNAGDPIELTINGITIAYQGAVNASTAPADFRVYANQNLTLSATSNISKVTIAGKANKAGWAPTVSAGEITTGASYEGITTKATLEDPLFVVENINAQSISITCNKQLRAYMIEVTLAEGGETPPAPTMDYYVAGSMTNWGPMAAYKLVANPANEGEYMGEFTFAANDEFKVGYSDGITIESTNYFPNGMDNNYVITEAGDYTVYFRPDGQGGEDWHYGCINAIKKEEPVIPQYEVAQAIAAGLTDDTEILVRGVITKMEFKGKNFAKYGSVNIYVADATGAEGAFEFYNCYSLNADTFRTSDPAYDAESTAWAEYDEVADENGNAIHVGDTVIAFGKYKLYNSTHELNTGCYLTEIKHPGDAPVDPQPAELVAVSDSTTWEFNKLAANQESALYNNEGIQLTEESTPSKNDEVIYSEYDETILTIGEGFNGAALSFKGEYPIRKNKYCQAGELHFKAAVAGNIIVKFSDTGSKASATAVKRYLVVNDEQTEYWASRENNGEADPYPAQLDVTTGSIPVPAGDVIIKGSSAIVVYFVTFVPEAAPQPEHTYSVVGPLTPGGWDATSTACDMALGEDGKYHFVMSEVQLVANAVNEYKIVEDHAWAVAFPQQGNAEFTVEKSGIYDLEFVLDLNAETPYSVIPTLIEEIVVVPSIAMHGNFLGSWADTENFTVAEDNATASLSLNIAAGNYEFGMRIGSSSNWTANGAAFTRENNGAVIEAGQGNLTLAADLAGEYLFTWTFADNSLVITYPEAPVEGDTINVTISSLTNPGQVMYADAIASYGYWDIYAYNDQYEIEISNIFTTEAAGTYTIDDLDANYTYIVPAEGDTVHFTAGQVVLSITDGVVNVAGQLTGDDNNIYNINLTYADPKAERVANVTISNGTLYDGYASAGLYAVYGTADDNTAYVQLSIWADTFSGDFTEDDLDLQYVGSGVRDAEGSHSIFSAAITVTPGNGEGVYSITADLLCYNNTLYKVTMKIGEAQGIEDVEAAVKAIKRLVNGQVVIMKGDKTYNMNGAVIR